MIAQRKDLDKVDSRESKNSPPPLCYGGVGGGLLVIARKCEALTKQSTNLSQDS